ncbi:MAG: hypothetical protein GTO08_07140 [Deltaproteobacteria bacterium]|nr:hypothetical protein [Deltaproteobacteria bacterium]
MRGIVKIFLIGFVSAIIIVGCSNVFDAPAPAPKDDLDGFRGIKWGTRIKELNGMIYNETRDDSNLEHIKYDLYKKKNEKLVLGLVKLDEINYWFWQGRLGKVTIEASGGESVYNFLKDVCFEKFGQGKHKGKTGSDKARPQYTYQWVGKNIHISLSYYKWGETIIWLNSQEMITEQYDYLRKKVKEGAEKGF